MSAYSRNSAVDVIAPGAHASGKLPSLCVPKERLCLFIEAPVPAEHASGQGA